MDKILVFLSVLALGSILGSIPIKGFYLESMGILIVGAIFGHFGYLVDPVFMDLGIVLFVYGLALQIAPGFIESFRQDGLKFSLIALFTAAFGVVVLFLIKIIFGFSSGIFYGIYTGAYNSAIGLATLMNNHSDPQITRIFGLTYPLAFAIMMIYIPLIPKILKADMKKEIEEYLYKQKRLHPAPIRKYFSVVNPGCFGKKMNEILIPGVEGVSISKVLRNNKVITPDDDFIFQKGDIAEAWGDEKSVENMKTILGAEAEITRFPEVPSNEVVVKRYLVTNKKIVGKKIRNLALRERYGISITRIRRGGMDIPVYPYTSLAYGDRLTVVVHKNFVSQAIKIFGNDLHAFSKQELYPVTIGLLIGALLGSINFFGIFRLGIAGGVLVAGLVLGRLSKVGPVVFTVTPQSNHVLKRFGLMIFMAALGTQSGNGMLTQLASSGYSVVIYTAVVIFLSITFSIVLTRFVFKKNIVEVLAIVAGSIACTPALEMANSKLEKADASGVYAAIYPVGLMSPVIMVQLVIWIASFGVF